MGTLFNGKIIKKSFFRLFTIYCWGSQSVIYKQALIAGKHQYYKYWGNPHPVPSISISIKSSAQNILFLLRPHQIQFCPAPAQPGPRLIYSPVILLSLALWLSIWMWNMSPLHLIFSPSLYQWWATVQAAGAVGHQDNQNHPVTSVEFTGRG